MVVLCIAPDFRLNYLTVDFYSIPIQGYVNQISVEVGNRINQMSAHLNLVIEIGAFEEPPCRFTFSDAWYLGIPAIRYGQRRTHETLLSVSAGATFFSAVTATMLQISYSVERSYIINIVNTFWYISLVLSIGSALNSLLSMGWRQSV